MVEGNQEWDITVPRDLAAVTKTQLSQPVSKPGRSRRSHLRSPKES